MAINTEAWNIVRNELNRLNNDGVPSAATTAFAEIEKDVERLIQELQSNQTAERELRAALEEPGGAETQRR